MVDLSLGRKVVFWRGARGHGEQEQEVGGERRCLGSFSAC